MRLGAKRRESAIKSDLAIADTSIAEKRGQIGLAENTAIIA